MILRSIAANPTPDTWIHRAAANNPFKGLVKYGTDPIITATKAWEGTSPQDLKVWLVGDEYLGYYAAGPAMDYDFGLMICPVVGYPFGWVHPDAPLVTHGHHAGLDDVLISSPYLVQRDAGDWLLFGHGYNGSTGSLLMWRGPTAKGPWTWFDGNPLVVPAGWCSAVVQGAMVLPGRQSPDGKMHMMFGGSTSLSETGFRGGHAVSEDDGLTWTEDATPPLVVGPTGSWCDGGIHPVGQFLPIGDVVYVPAQGWKVGGTWTMGALATRDFAQFFELPSPYLSPGQWTGVTAIENPGLVYHAATGKLDQFPVAALSGYGSTDYAIFLARS